MGERVFFTEKTVADMRLLLERGFGGWEGGRVSAADAQHFLQDLYEEGYMLMKVTEV